MALYPASRRSSGFLRVLDETTLGFADFRGNRQYLTLGNLVDEDRVALFLMDIPVVSASRSWRACPRTT